MFLSLHELPHQSRNLGRYNTFSLESQLQALLTHAFLKIGDNWLPEK